MTRLRRSRLDRPGITRVRAGRGFTYREPDGRRLTDEAAIERVRALAIPPAWADVWIAPDGHDHVQATGVDVAGRRQYLYHDAWRATRDHAKFDRALDLAQTLSGARRGVTTDLREPGLSMERVLAGAFRLLDRGSLRIGGEQYATACGSVGLTTLLVKHAQISAEGRVRLHFPAKSGQSWDSEVDDPDLAALLGDLLRRSRSARLLAWQDDGGAWHPLRAEDVNADVRQRTGGDFTAKDFRTLHGTVAAAKALARIGWTATESAQRRAISKAMQEVAAELGNTPAIARKSYVDPRVLERYRMGELIEASPRDSGEAALRAFLLE